MARVHWLDVPRSGSHRMLKGVVPIDAGEALTSPALKSALNLAARACSQLSLAGRYALQASRTDGTQVHLCFELAEDAHRFAEAIGVPHPFAQQDATFVFDLPILERLEAVGGARDRRSVDRRKREREERDRHQLNWAQRPFSGPLSRREKW